MRDLDKLLQPIRTEFESAENKKLTAEAYPVEKKKKGPPAAKGAGGSSDLMSPNRLDLRIGRITSVEKVRTQLLCLVIVENTTSLFSYCREHNLSD